VSTPASAHRTGLLLAITTYVAWGLFPLYFKLVSHVPPVVVLAHRVAWSAVFLALVLTAQRQWAAARAATRDRRTLATLVASAVLIAVNWFAFIYAISIGQVLQCSLGYFINPLVSVLLGVAFLRERLRPGQVAALALAAAGVLNLAIVLGQFPWIAVALAASFGLYGLLRKTTAAGPLVGLAVETGVLLPAALVLILLHELSPLRATTGDPTTYALLASSGVLTAIPLLMFAAAARRLRLSTMGFLQYLVPTGQFLLAVLLYHEPFTRTHAMSFGLIWVALALYTADSIRALRTRSAAGDPAARAEGVAVIEP